ncbi:MAG TPA: hypothetical protein VNZ26_31860, partial [Vicinamibacterales bacterium]|nr:hypothetical protein [Vicinamibacterales bacterium]
MILKRSLARTGTRFLPALTVAILLTRFLPIWTPVWAAVTFDNATDLGTTTGTSLSGSHTMGAGSGGILFVCIHSPAVSINVNNVSGVTFNSVALTEDIDTHSSGDTGYNAQIWRLNGPASGSHTLAITLSSTSAVISAHVVSYTGAASTGQPDASHSVGTGCCPTTGTDSVTTVTANDWGVSCTWGQFAQPTISTGLVNS